MKILNLKYLLIDTRFKENLREVVNSIVELVAISNKITVIGKKALPLCTFCKMLRKDE